MLFSSGIGSERCECGSGFALAKKLFTCCWPEGLG